MEEECVTLKNNCTYKLLSEFTNYLILDLMVYFQFSFSSFAFVCVIYLFSV